MTNRNDHSKWERIIAAWKESGETKSSFCKKNKISMSSLYKWLERLGHNPQSATKNLLKKQKLHEVSPIFKEITVKNESQIKQSQPTRYRFLIITTTSGCRLEVPL